MDRQHREKGGEAQNRVMSKEDIAKQTNRGYCDVFVCQYSEKTKRKARMDFHKRDTTDAESMNTITIENLELKFKLQDRKREAQIKKRQLKRGRKGKGEKIKTLNVVGLSLDGVRHGVCLQSVKLKYF